MHDLNQQVVVITGGAGLIGRAFVETVLQYNGRAVIADYNVSHSEDVQNVLKKNFPDSEVCYFQLDINSPSSVQSLIESVNQKYGTIDALVNSAYPKNPRYGAHLFDVGYADFCENVNLQLGGYFLTTQQFAAYFQKKGKGNVVNIASIQGIVAPKFDTYQGTQMTSPIEYSMVKSALIRLTEYMAKYCKDKNIRFNTISPGGILDGQPEVFLEKYREKCFSKGMLDPEDLKGTLIYLLSDMSKYVNGQNIIVDDGFTI